MKVYVESVLPCFVELAWQEVQKPSLLIEVAWPLVTFKPVIPNQFPSKWQQGETVSLRLYLFGIVPIGIRELHFERVDNQDHEIQTRERDLLIRKWDHLISVKRLDANTTHYSDEIEIDAGLLTIPIFLFAHIFYRHRQRRWKKMARRWSK